MNLTIKEKILKEFELVNSFTTEDIVDLLNITNGYARTIAYRMVRSGDLERIDLATFRIVERDIDITTSERISDILYEQFELLARRNYDEITASEMRKNINTMLEIVKSGRL